MLSAKSAFQMSDKDKLAQLHLGLVHACCKRFSGKGIEYEELYAAGCLGLTKAINNFDDSRGLQFSTYAFPVIMGEIKRLFRDGGSVRVSRSLRELSLKINRLNNENELKNGTEMTVSQLSKILNVSPEEVAEAMNSDHELYGTERLLEVLNSDPNASPQQVLENVTNGINAFVGEAEQFDDITMIGFTYYGSDGNTDIS